MSSRIIQPDEPAVTGPMVWKKIAAVPAPAPEPIAEPPAGSAMEESLQQLQQECERREREARAAGFREGEAAGRSSAAAEIQPVLERLVRSIDELAHLRARFRREAEADMVRLSLAVAHRILRRELAVDPDAMHGLVLAALEKLQAQDVCRVRVHPAHAAQIAAGLRQLAPGANVEVIPDAAREPGALVFETTHGNLDAGVGSQLHEIERGLIDRLKRQSHE